MIYDIVLIKSVNEAVNDSEQKKSLYTIYIISIIFTIFIILISFLAIIGIKKDNKKYV
jgi:hypothetical protein